MESCVKPLTWGANVLGLTGNRRAPREEVLAADPGVSRAASPAAPGVMGRLKPRPCCTRSVFLEAEAPPGMPIKGARPRAAYGAADPRQPRFNARFPDRHGDALGWRFRSGVRTLTGAANADAIRVFGSAWSHRKVLYGPS